MFLTLHLMLADLPFDPRLLLLFVPFALLLFTLTWRSKPAALSYPYTAVRSLFSAGERDFLRVLERAAPGTRVFGKVRLADVITVQKGLPKSDWQRAFNRIGNKHLDFVLCRPGDLSIICVLELDDKSHERAERKARDAFLEAALKAAQVPLVRVPSRKSYDVHALRDLLPLASGMVDEPRPAPVERVIDVGTKPAQIP